jgi:L-seryl-tRNA(Ser) seleniumtransferase
MVADPSASLRRLPAVDTVLQDPAAQSLVADNGRHETVAAIRATLDALRARIARGEAPPCAAADVASMAFDRLAAGRRPNLRRVVNATGIILHTGLGRAFMPEAARAALADVSGYCNLQQDLDTGRRDQREDCLRDLVRDLTGAEDILVVNNNAAATLLVLAALSRGKEAIVSRGELIEIGGSFRLPDIMAESGAMLREIGTTNKTHLRDYDQAAGPRTGLILKAHRSNYRIVGFTHEVSIADIVTVGKKHGVPVVDDLGCGALVGLEAFGLPHEGTVQESLAAGVDLALFSTDKLIGGPQGGMILGRRDVVARVRAHPLYRAFRVCKLTLGALEATLRLFKAPDRLAVTHPVYRMLARTPDQMKVQAGELADALRRRQPGWTVTTGPDTSFLGGGTLPEEGMPSFTVRITVPGVSADELARRFRLAAVPVVARIHDAQVVLDMRTVSPSDHDDILAGTTTPS